MLIGDIKMITENNKIHLYQDLLWALFARNNPSFKPRRKWATAKRWAKVASYVTSYLKMLTDDHVPDLKKWARDLSDNQEESIIKCPPCYVPCREGSLRRNYSDKGGIEGSVIETLAEIVNYFYVSSQSLTRNDDPEYSPTIREYNDWAKMYPLTSSGDERMITEWEFCFDKNGIYRIAVKVNDTSKQDDLFDFIKKATIAFNGEVWKARIDKDIVFIEPNTAYCNPPDIQKIKKFGRWLANSICSSITISVNPDLPNNMSYVYKYDLVISYNNMHTNNDSHLFNDVSN